MGQISAYDKWLYDQVDKYMEEQDRMTCENCTHYIDGCCWKNSNADNLPDCKQDSKSPEDYCDDWEYNELSDD